MCDLNMSIMTFVPHIYGMIYNYPENGDGVDISTNCHMTISLNQDCLLHYDSTFENPLTAVNLTTQSYRHTNCGNHAWHALPSCEWTWSFS